MAVADKTKEDAKAYHKEKAEIAKTDSEKPLQFDKNKIPITAEALSALMQDRSKVVIAPFALGLEFPNPEKISVEESLGITAGAKQLSEHAQFMVGDAINLGRASWGDDRYRAAMERCQLSYKTLWEYAETSRLIPLNKRLPELPFTHHATVARLKDREKIDDVLKSIKPKKGESPLPKNELRDEIKSMMPKKKSPKKAISGKGKKSKGKPVEIYKMTAEEQSMLDQAEEKFSEAAELIVHLKSLFKKLNDNKERKHFLAILKPIAIFYRDEEARTGY